MSAEVKSMAYRGEVPWHGLGHKLPEGATIDQWKKAAGMEWKVVRTPLHYNVGNQEYNAGIRDALIRSDDPSVVLGIVGADYKPVQPSEVIEFFRESVEKSDFTMETAGCLKEGKRIWGLARMNDQFHIGKSKTDIIKPYLLLSTSTDGYSATFAAFTTVRVVCKNTLELARQDIGKSRVRVDHSNTFNAQAVKEMLGLAPESFKQFKEDATRLSKRKVSSEEAVAYFIDVLDLKKKENSKVDVADSATFGRKMNKILQLYVGGPGAELSSSNGTAWGLVNAITRYADFEAKAEDAGNRLEAAWFGAAAKLKAVAMQKAMVLA